MRGLIVMLVLAAAVWQFQRFRDEDARTTASYLAIAAALDSGRDFASVAPEQQQRFLAESGWSSVDVENLNSVVMIHGIQEHSVRLAMEIGTLDTKPMLVAAEAKADASGRLIARIAAGLRRRDPAAALVELRAAATGK